MAGSKSSSGSADPRNPNKDCKPSSTEATIREVFKKAVKLALVLITFSVYLLIVPVFAVFMFPVYIYRGLVIILQKIFHPEWVCIMNSRDALVGLDDTTKRCDCMIVASVVFRGVPDMQRIREHFEKNVMQVKNAKGGNEYEKLTHYYENWMGFPFWKQEKEFKLEEHLRLFDYKVNTTTAIDRNGKEAEYVTEEDLLRCCGEIEKLPFAKGQSPWEILVLPNFIPKEESLHRACVIPQMTTQIGNGGDAEDNKYFTLLYRVHHAIGDGYSFMKMLMCNICNEPIESVPKAPSREFNFFIKILNSIAILIFTPYYHFKQFFLEIDTSLWHLSTNKLSKQSHFVSTERISMERLKQVGKVHNVPLTGVLLAGLAGGIRNFLKLTGKSHNLPKFMRALSPMPWKNHPSIRPSGDGMTNHWY